MNAHEKRAENSARPLSKHVGSSSALWEFRCADTCVYLECTVTSESEAGSLLGWASPASVGQS